MTTSQVLTGVGLILALAVGSQVLAGRLFISISATVTPASLRHLVLPTLGLIAVLVLVNRPLVALLATARTDLMICTRPADGVAAAGGSLLFLVRADGKLAPVTRTGPPEPQEGDNMVLLVAAADGS